MSHNQKLYRKLTGASLLALTIAAPFSAVQAQVLDEIIVTSQKREQTLQDVPISISAISGKTIENRSIDSLATLAGSMPNVFIEEKQIDSAISVRGVATGDNKGFEQSVGMYFDGISYGRSQLIRTPLVDLERVEVLRGPQPTLFGKNAIAGAVNVISAKPTDEFEGKISASYEFEHEEPQLLGVLSGPISENLTARLTASYRELGGWIENTNLKRLEPKRQEYYLRGQLAWSDGGPLDLHLKAEYASFDKAGFSMEALLPQDGYSAVFAGPIAVETNEDWVRSSGEVSSDNEMFNTVLTANYQMGDHTLTSITGYVEYDTLEITDVDYVGLDILDGTNQTEDYSQFSQELRLTSPGGEKLDYIAGLFYQSSDVNVTDFVPLGTFLALAGPPVSSLVGSNWDRNFDQSSDVYSAFAQADLNVNEKVTITAGARYTHEKKVGARQLEIQQGPTNTTPLPVLNALWGAVLNVGPHDIASSRKEDSFDPLLRIQYRASDAISLHASYTEGSKSGGFDVRGNSIPGTPGIATPGSFEFEGENATNYEVGAKMKWDRAQVNLSVFQTDYSNLQTNIFDGVLGFLVENASEAKVKGVEADGRFLVTNNLEIYGSAAYLDYEYTDFKQSQCGYKEAPETDPTSPSFGFCDRSGFTAPFAPKFTTNFGLDYNRDISENLALDVNVNVDTSSKYFLASNLDANIVEDGFTKLGGQIGVSSRDGAWRVSLIGDNLTDERIRVVGGTIPLAQTFVRLASGGALDGIAYDAIYARPRNITLKLDYNF